MRNFFIHYLIFSLLIFGQQGLFAKANLSQISNIDSQAHEHNHSFFTALKMIVTGTLEHDHDHDHEDDLPWTDSHNHQGKTHSHIEGHNLKVDLLSPSNMSYLISIEDHTNWTCYNRVHSFEIFSDIFRPPINS
jgi:hypothetical protein